MALPDFLIIGAMKCGTTTLAAQLAAQPGIFMTSPKEPNFFSDDRVYAAGLAWYETLFEDAAPGDLKGEASTHYTKLPTYPDTVGRMRALLPAPKLIYVVRDPVERAVSHFIHEWTEGRMSDDPVTAFATHTELVDYGLYAKQITPFIDAYGVDAVCLTSLERIKMNPQAELERVAAHIGFSGHPVWRAELGAQNVSQARIRKLPFHRVLVNNQVSRSLRRRLVPKSVRTRIRQGRSFGARPELPAALRSELQARFAPDHIALTRLFPGVLDGAEDIVKEIAQ
ncbi:MAG: sulfotransferase domain-containing protein [Pseudomonadota bacterium]